jgi:CheY-like chemotaxis protein
MMDDAVRDEVDAAAEPDQPLVLLVEDYQDARDMYADYLRFAGFRVAEAGNGIDALEQARALLPDIVLMDLSLPRLDGWEATRRLKADPRTKHIPILVLTGHAQADDAEGARRAGCDAFLAKPCLPDVVASRLEAVLAAGRAARQVAGADRARQV